MSSNTSDHYEHLSVLLKPTVCSLELDRFIEAMCLDCTFGGGGHSKAILNTFSNLKNLIACDQDREALNNAKNIDFGDNYSKLNLIHSSFASLAAQFKKEDIKFHGIIADLGVSSHHFDTHERGFSFRFDAPLDMRMNQQQSMRAWDIINESDKEKLIHLFRVYGEEKYAVRIAEKIVVQRQTKTIDTTKELADICYHSYPAKLRFGKIHPATKVFQALRIETNQELQQLETLLDVGLDLLEPGGRLAIISFHSLEDRMVKDVFKKWSGRDKEIEKQAHPLAHFQPREFPSFGKIIKPFPIKADAEEIKQNPRSRSARLRVFEKA